jgi:hypothetical protein
MHLSSSEFDSGHAGLCVCFTSETKAKVDHEREWPLVVLSQRRFEAFFDAPHPSFEDSVQWYTLVLSLLALVNGQMM